MSDQDKTAMIGNELLRKRRAPHWIRVFRGVRNIHEDDGRWKGAYWTPVCLAALTFALGGDDPGVVVGTLRTRLLNFHQGRTGSKAASTLLTTRPASLLGRMFCGTRTPRTRASRGIKHSAEL